MEKSTTFYLTWKKISAILCQQFEKKNRKMVRIKNNPVATLLLMLLLFISVLVISLNPTSLFLWGMEAIVSGVVIMLYFYTIRH